MTTRLKTRTFVGSILLAILAGLGQLRGDWAVWVLALLGLVVGFLNRSKLEFTGFLLSAIALRLSAGAAEVIPEVGPAATNILNNIVVFVSAILLFVAVREIFGAIDLKSYSIWALALGVIMALLSALGIFSGTWPIGLLAVIGVAVGILNLTRKGIDKEETGRFIVSSIALLLSANAFNDIPIIGALLTGFFTSIVILISATLLVVAFVVTFRSLDEA